MKVEYSSSSLMQSIKSGNTAAVKLFIEAGMPLNKIYETTYQEPDGNVLPHWKLTPLLLSLSKFGNFEIANLLLDSGADVNMYKYHENTQAGVNLRSNTRLEATPLFLAATNRNKFSLQERKALTMKIIEKGADVNAGFESNDKPLNWAIDIGDPQIVKAMLNRGAKVTKSVLEATERRRRRGPDWQRIYDLVRNANSPQ